MRFASIVFRAAAVWGVLVVVPLAFMFTGAGDPTATFSYPQAYFGFLGVVLAWQVVFWIIGGEPDRYRPLMPVAVLEKAVYIVAVTALIATGRITGAQATSAVPDAILGVLFTAAYVKSR